MGRGLSLPSVPESLREDQECSPKPLGTHLLGLHSHTCHSSQAHFCQTYKVRIRTLIMVLAGITQCVKTLALPPAHSLMGPQFSISTGRKLCGRNCIERLDCKSKLRSVFRAAQGHGIWSTERSRIWYQATLALHGITGTLTHLFNLPLLISNHESSTSSGQKDPATQSTSPKFVFAQNTQTKSLILFPLTTVSTFPLVDGQLLSFPSSCLHQETLPGHFLVPTAPFS